MSSDHFLKFGFLKIMLLLILQQIALSFLLQTHTENRAVQVFHLNLQLNIVLCFLTRSHCTRTHHKECTSFVNEINISISLISHQGIFPAIFEPLCGYRNAAPQTMYYSRLSSRGREPRTLEPLCSIKSAAALPARPLKKTVDRWLSGCCCFYTTNQVKEENQEA